ncbi:glycosyl hydrolase family 18 protein [Paenibacillus sp. S-12]|uniref:glycosyl hydrolase family 18 protein n=1 Tax=Paenibacillus sp. S-12 TaxID=3031371 RepID=UPI0025A1F12C|nr:glycosyl hydrolase family 18 protein [Paenibacillus sp. S-12]
MYKTKSPIGIRKHAMRIFLLFVVLLVMMSALFWPGGGSGLVSAFSSDLPGTKASSSYKSVAYFTSWGIYGRNYQVTDIDASKLTHLNYAFFDICWNGKHGNPSTSSDNPNKKTWSCTDPGVPLQKGNVPTGAIVLGEPWADVNTNFGGALNLPYEDCQKGKCGNIARLKQLKSKNPHLKTLFSVGGWTWSNRFSDVAANEQYRINFAKSAVDAIREYGFDGIDIDWEYPGVEGIKGNSYSPNDKFNFTKLLAEVRKQLDAAGAQDGKQYLLTLATGASQRYIDNAEMDKVMQLVDFINIMTYDFHGGWEKATNHTTGLYEDPRDPAAATKFYVDGAIQVYERAGVDLSKVVMGLAVYGVGWKGCDPGPNNDGLYQACKGGWDGNVRPNGTWDNWESGASGVFDYGDVAANYVNKNGYQRYWNDSAKVPYLFNAATGVFLSYDDNQSIGYKTSYIKSKGLGGAMYWDLSSDCRTSSKYTCSGQKIVDKVAADLGISGTNPGNEPPTVPQGLSVVQATYSSVTFKWNPSISNVGISGYEAYKDGNLALSTSKTEATITGLTDNTEYRFTVKAKDTLGNRSEASAPLLVRTANKPPVDTDPPSAPTQVVVTGKTDTTVSLSWLPSTGKTSVVRYEVWLSGGTVAQAKGTSVTVTGLTPETSYSFTITAVDTLGYRSEPSQPVTVVTDKSTKPDVSFIFTVTSDWGSGYNFQGTLTNNGSAGISNWHLEFDYSGSISQIWDARIVSRNGNHYIIESAGWNDSIPSKGSISFGGGGSPGGNSLQPSNIVVTWK